MCTRHNDTHTSWHDAYFWSGKDFFNFSNYLAFHAKCVTLPTNQYFCKITLLCNNSLHLKCKMFLVNLERSTTRFKKSNAESGLVLSKAYSDAIYFLPFFNRILRTIGLLYQNNSNHENSFISCGRIGNYYIAKANFQILHYYKSFSLLYNIYYAWR